MDDQFHYLLMTAQNLFQRMVMEDLEGSGLTPGQPKVLDYLGGHNGCVQKEIAVGCQIDPATLTGVLGRMEEKQLIERRSAPGDRRSLHVYLTAQGRRRLADVQQTFGRLEEQLLGDLDQADRAHFLEILAQLCKKMMNAEVFS